MAHADKHVEHIKKYVANINEAAVAGIERHLGIALRNRDAALVAGTDPNELKTVRESWLKKKLGLTASDADLDRAIHEVMAKMKAERAKDRVAVYYLLADHFKKLDMLAQPAAAHKPGGKK
jgi:hypothetical protein